MNIFPQMYVVEYYQIIPTLEDVVDVMTIYPFFDCLVCLVKCPKTDGRVCLPAIHIPVLREDKDSGICTPPAVCIDWNTNDLCVPPENSDPDRYEMFPFRNDLAKFRVLVDDFSAFSAKYFQLEIWTLMGFSMRGIPSILFKGVLKTKIYRKSGEVFAEAGQNVEFLLSNGKRRSADTIWYTLNERTSETDEDGDQKFRVQK